VVTKFDGKTVERFTDLARIVSATKPGTKANIQVFRNGSFRDLSVVVGEFKEPAPRGAEGEGGKAAPVGNAFGLTLGELTEAQRKALPVPARKDNPTEAPAGATRTYPPLEPR
jgi:serine protease Do